MVLELNDQNFSQEVEKFSGVALVDFWAPWCGPCKVQGPIVEELSQDFVGNAEVKINKLNVDENPRTAESFEIMSIPTLKIFKAGQPVEEFIGVQDKSTLSAKIKKHLS